MNNSRLWKSFALAATLTLTLGSVGSAEAACIGTPTPGKTWTNLDIQAELDAGRHAILCANSIFDMNDSVVFPVYSDGLSIYTEGQPVDDSRALLRVMNPNLSTAVMAAGWDGDNQTWVVGHDGASLHHVRVDGGYERMGKCTTGCGAYSLIWFGGPTRDQSVHHVKASGSRGWSTISLDRVPSAAHNGCSYASVYSNVVIGPQGAWPLSQAEPDILTDGLSIRCEFTSVYDNDIYDATDMGIAIFGAPFSTFTNNEIFFNNNKSVGGISMSDQWGVADGSYDDVLVSGNVITANTYTRMAISMGRMLGTCEVNNNNWGATVTNNAVYGRTGYSYAVAGVFDWTVTGNYDYATHPGSTLRGICDSKYPPSPRGFVKQAGYSTGTFQSQFTTTTSTQSLRRAELRYP